MYITPSQGAARFIAVPRNERSEWSLALASCYVVISDDFHFLILTQFLVQAKELNRSLAFLMTNQNLLN